MVSLEADAITHRYGSGPRSVTALDGVSLVVEPGSVVAVLGPSGSGKSTLLAILGGLLTPTAGEVRIGGTRLSGLRASARAALRAREVGFVFQLHNLVPYLTARENLEVVAGLLDPSAPRTRLRTRAQALLEELGIEARADHLPSELSVGERQRVAIGRALMHEPSVLLADEPTASLDTERGEEVVALLADQAGARGVAVVLVTHDRRMTARADRVHHLVDGRLT